MKRHDKDIEDELRSWLNDANNVVVAGIGNAIRSDDFVGVKVVMGLQGKVSPAVTLIECETVPESFVDEMGKGRRRAPGRCRPSRPRSGRRPSLRGRGGNQRTLDITHTRL